MHQSGVSRETAPGLCWLLMISRGSAASVTYYMPGPVDPTRIVSANFRLSWDRRSTRPGLLDSWGKPQKSQIERKKQAAHLVNVQTARSDEHRLGQQDANGIKSCKQKTEAGSLETKCHPM